MPASSSPDSRFDRPHDSGAGPLPSDQDELSELIRTRFIVIKVECVEEARRQVPTLRFDVACRTERRRERCSCVPLSNASLCHCTGFTAFAAFDRRLWLTPGTRSRWLLDLRGLRPDGLPAAVALLIDIHMPEAP
jgi:hypothetical protein